MPFWLKYGMSFRLEIPASSHFYLSVTCGQVFVTSSIPSVTFAVLTVIMSAGEPTVEEMTAMDTIAKVADWVPLRGELRAKFYECVGLEPNDPPRVLATITREAFDAVLPTVRVGEAAPPPALRARLELMWEVSRKITGVIPTAEVQKQLDKEKADLEAKKLDLLQAQARARTGAEAGSVEVKTVATDKGEDLVKFSEAMIQGSGVEVKPVR